MWSIIPYMASVKRDPRTRFWIACYRLPDGTRRQRSTKSTDKSIALQAALAAEKASRRRMMADAARGLLADVLTSINEDGDALARESASAFFDRWLARKRREIGANTTVRYEQVIAGFRAFAGDAALAGPMENITPILLSRYRDNLVERYAPATANFCLKIIRSSFAEAMRDGVITTDPAARIRPLRMARAAASPRRALTSREVRAVVGATNPDSEWRGMVLAGVYTGQRLGDIATMNNKDVARGWWRFTARKTGAVMAIPLAKPLVEWMAKHGAKSGYVFPEAAARVGDNNRVGTLSNQFHSILARAGLVEPRSHNTSLGKGRGARRSAGSLSFHYLRHTTNTMLKEAGVPESVAMAILGHESRQISRIYTHMPEKSLKEAVEKLGAWDSAL